MHLLGGGALSMKYIAVVWYTHKPLLLCQGSFLRCSLVRVARQGEFSTLRTSKLFAKDLAAGQRCRAPKWQLLAWKISPDVGYALTHTKNDVTNKL